jgi:predicted Zn-dependent protease
MNLATNIKIPKILLGIVLLASTSLAIAFYPYTSKPCTKPTLYSIGQFDKQFNLSEDQYLRAINEARAIWEKPAGKTLFAYSAQGKLTINLVYDYRQQVTQKLKSLGITIDSTKSSYDSLSAKYKEMVGSYNAEKTRLETLINQYNTLKAKYEAEVKVWNNYKGTDAEYDRLRQEYRDLDDLLKQINSQKDQLNSKVENINALGVSLNQLASQLNLNVRTYNQIGSSTGSEFEEGVFVSNAKGKKIDIYEYSNHAELVRVLAHELGHALGLAHVDDPDAIMYKLNQSKNEKPTAADIGELNRVCGLTP